MSKPILAIISWAAVLTWLPTWGQEQPTTQGPSDSASMTGQEMSNRPAEDMTNRKAMPSMREAARNHNEVQIGGQPVMHSMEGKHMDMGPHMKMTNLREPKDGDQARAEKVVEIARQATEKYQDYRLALKDGYKIFLPNVPQKQYHFTNHGYVVEAAFRFNPEHPTSLLYEKHGDGYKLIGLMYTAPTKATEDDLDKRIPLSVAQWHEHVNFCAPPPGKQREMWEAHAKFGLAGSIVTKEACDAAQGKFYPVIFNWMVHVYPFAQGQEEVWAVDRGHDHHCGD